MTAPPKPSRTFSKRLTVVAFALAWPTLWLAMWQGPAMAQAIAPHMVLLVLLGSLGYQAVGHMDLRALLGRPEAAAEPAAPAPAAPETAPEAPR